MPTTIGRNRRQFVINVRDSFTECRRYNQTTGKMDACNPDEAWDLLERAKNARLVEADDQRSYTIRLGSEVYELRQPEPRA
jgi:hypothetical protein